MFPLNVSEEEHTEFSKIYFLGNTEIKDPKDEDMIHAKIAELTKVWIILGVSLCLNLI